MKSEINKKKFKLFDSQREGKGVEKGEDLTPAKYFLGSDLDDEFDEIADNPL